MSRAAFLLAVLLSFGPAVSNSFARFAYALVLPAMRDELALDYAQAGWLNTANAIGYLAGAIATRLVVARIGNRALFGAGMIVTALAVLMTGLAQSSGGLAAARAVAGFAGAMVFICGGALSANIAPDEPRAASTAITVYFAGGGLGLVLCGVTIPVLLDVVGSGAWRDAWIGMGVVGLVMAAASLWAVARIAEPGAAASNPALAPSTRVDRAPRQRLLAAAIAYLCFGLGYIGYMTFIIAWVRDRGGSTTEVIALWSTLGLATLAAPVVWRIPLATWRGGRALAAITAVLALAAALPLVDTRLPILLASGALFGVAMFSVPSAIQSLVKHGLARRDWGPAMAGFTIVFAGGQVAGPMAAGVLADLVGSLAPGLAASAAILALGALASLAQRDVRDAPR